MANFYDIIKEAKEKGILLDGCGLADREKQYGKYIDLCGMSIADFIKPDSGSGEGLNIVITDSLSESGEEHVLYFVGPLEEGGDEYEAYFWENNEWNKLIGVSGDMSNYYTIDETNSAITEAEEDKVIGSGVTDVVKLTRSEYDELEVKSPTTLYIVLPDCDDECCDCDGECCDGECA